MQNSPRLEGGLLPWMLPYAVAVLMTAAVTGLSRLLAPFLHEQHPYVLFIASVYVTARYGGWKPALCALILGVLAGDLLFMGSSTDAVAKEVALALFLLVGSGFIFLSEKERAARQTLQAHAVLLEKEVAARREVEARYHRLATIIASSSDAIIGTYSDGTITEWNGGATQLYGYAAEEVMGEHVSLIIPPDRSHELTNNFQKLQRGERVPPFETERRRKDGKEVIVSVSIFPMIEEGRLVGVASIARDLTYTKRLEDQLRQAVKMEAVGRLAGGVAHDFNNLLTTIVGYSAMLLTNLRPSDTAYGQVKEIKRAADRAAQLTRQLLAYSRRQLLKPKILDLNIVITDLAHMLGRMMGDDIVLLTRLEPQLGRVQADPTQIEQVIMNLAANARDAMPRGGTLTIRTDNSELDEAYAELHAGTQPGHYVLLELSDTGCGMDEGTREHIFEPFFTTKEVGKGTGLGLATVYGIVKQSGGCIDVISAPGHGATFRVFLPRLEQPAEKKDSVETTPTLPRGTETVLLVEDDDMVRGFTRMLLRMGGYQVLEACRGPDALHLSEKHPGPIHLLVTDVVMPEMTGRQLAEQLLQRRPELKVLFLSGHTEDTLMQHGVSETETALLAKPFTPAELGLKVREVLASPIPAQTT